MRTQIALVGSLVLAATLSAQSSQMGNDKNAMGAMGAMDHAAGSMGSSGVKSEFTGVGGRKATGGFEVVTEDGRQVLRLSRDFSVAEAPDAAIVLSATGAVDAGSVNLGRLPHAKGTATFRIPAQINLAQYHRVVIWSRKLGVAFAEAPLGGGSGSGMMHDNMGHHD